MTEPWLAVLQMVALRTPSLVVGGVGLWLAISRRRRHRRVSIYAAIGFGGLLVDVFVFFGLQVWIRLSVAAGRGIEVASDLMKWTVATYPVSLIALAALTVAVFIDRTPSRTDV